MVASRLTMATNAQLTPIEKAKQSAAYACADEHIRSGMRIGVGSGTTAKFLVDWIHDRYSTGSIKDIVCVPTSFQTRLWLNEAQLPVFSPDVTTEFDVAIDGADEIDEHLNCIKGGGACLTQEKIVQSCAKKFLIIGDDSKLSKVLGERYKSVPVEVVPFGYAPVSRWITQREGGHCELRMSKSKAGPVITDNNNYILDWFFPQPGAQKDWKKINQRIQTLPGVVETGLFLEVAEAAYLANSSGKLEKLHAPHSGSS